MKYDYKFSEGSINGDIVSVCVDIVDYGEQTGSKEDFQKFLDQLKSEDDILHFGDHLANNNITIEDWDMDSIMIHIHSKELVDKIMDGWVEFLPYRPSVEECVYGSDTMSGEDFDIMYHNKIKLLSDAAWEFLSEFDDFIVETLSKLPDYVIVKCPECKSSDYKVMCEQLFNGRRYEDRICQGCRTVYRVTEAI